MSLALQLCGIFAITQVKIGHAFLFPEFSEWPCLLQRISGTQLLPIQLLSHCSRRRLRPKPIVILHAAFCSPPTFGGTLFYSSWTAGLNGHEPHFQSGVFAGRAAACSHGVAGQPCLSFSLKKTSLCGTHTAAPSHCQALCSLYLPKRQKLSPS